MKKTITFAILHFSIAFTVTYLITGSWVLGGLVALIEPTVNTIAYFFHEKVWERIEHKRAQRKLQASNPEASFSV
ncbi:MAG: putative membrane protein of unknown function DUF2061 [Idiomarinaceae bacterium HL-53]|nr:MAG: putative membrane protein of unknown function DUF2061 [Idiomarinaceae bacterium HL-53]CUS47960.1 Uncharacterized membrane protein [Idiomarinaceae bacterium HL-53]